MTSTSDIVEAILTAKATSLTFGKFPEEGSIDDVNAGAKAYLELAMRNTDRTPHHKEIIFPLTVEATSEELLETYEDEILKADSAHPGGYDRATDGTSGYPFWISIVPLQELYPSQNIYRITFLVISKWSLL